MDIQHYLIYQDVSNNLTWTHKISMWLIVLFIDHILLMRTLALCGNNRFCSITLYFLLLLESCSRLAVLIKTVVADLNFPTEDESCVDFKHCLQPSSVTIYWVFPMAYQLILCAITCYRSSKYHRIGQFRFLSLIGVIVVDHAYYFLIIISCSIANITYCYKASEINIAARTFLTLFGSTSFQCLFGSHMCIRLRCAGNRDFEPSVKTTFKTPIPVSAAQFADRHTIKSLCNVPTVPSRVHSSRTRSNTSDSFGTSHESSPSGIMDSFDQKSSRYSYV
ncbi:hypothetical protein PNOK_0732500 [Pyrrhoderma noxium]|uniref:Uncharacterized protein n=1 Tax=Pyrrhoderma noxium TaxID=2282107 RepID=A0A286UCD1_9AGAM|nr:hypothetical protein PNOK_0732500 [Pyrrhoderma noxium]